MNKKKNILQAVVGYFKDELLLYLMIFPAVGCSSPQ